MLKQITEKEALAAYTKGKDIKVLVPPTCINEPEWEDYEATLLSRLLDGIVYMADEEEKPEVVFAESITATKKQELTDEPIPDPEEPEAGGEETPKARNKVGVRLNLDNGKIKALHKAGWSNSKIAEEMGTTDVTIGARIKKMKERGEL